MKWNIVCDSSCDITELKHLADDTVFSIAPIKVRLGDNEYPDNETLDVDAMIDAMNKNKGSSSTACPSPLEFADYYMQAENVICITVTGRLSGSYNAAVTAADMVHETHPDIKIHVFNSRATSGGLVLLAMKANELIKEGKSFDEVVNDLEVYNNQLCLTFCLGSYDNLIKSGRMSPIVGAVATALKIKAVAKTTVQGEIEVIGKVRGEKISQIFMAKQMHEMKDLTKDRIIVSHCHNEEGAKNMRALLNQFGAYNVYIMPTRGLCSYYTGEGGLIIAY